MGKRRSSLDTTLPHLGALDLRLRVESGDRELFVDAGRSKLRFGRDEDIDLLVGDEYASRQHGVIAFRDGGFSLTDRSRNGTLVLAGEGPPLHVRGNTMKLPARGRVRVGHADGDGFSFVIEARSPDGTWQPVATGGSTPAESPSASRSVFRREGDYWTITYAQQTCRLKDTKGLQYLAQLLRHPGREMHVIEIATADTADQAARDADTTQVRGARTELPTGGLGDAGPLLDPAAKAAYKRRLEDLDEELQEARAHNDPERAAHIEEEIDFLARELSAAVGLGGRDRRAGSPAERARLNITRAIKTTIEKLGETNRPLAEHLSRAVKTGVFCSYDPDPNAPMSWIL